MNKVLVNVYVPILNTAYDIFIPVQLQLFEIIELIAKAVSELSQGRFYASGETVVSLRENGKILNINRTVFELGIGNGTRLMLI